MVNGLIRSLLYIDFDGVAVDDPDDVILEALDDPRYKQRIAPLARFLQDATAPAFDRFLACCALTAWAEPVGYRAVIAAASAGDEAVWFGALPHRLFSTDETFSQLAHAVWVSKDFVQEKSTQADRSAALRALIGIADRYYFDWTLAGAIDESTVGTVCDDVAATVRRGISVLAMKNERPSFELGPQLADLAVSMISVDEALAVELCSALARVDHSTGTLIRLAAIVSHGVTPQSRSFGEYLTTVGVADVVAAASRALSRRNF
ncbi:hypothetical protein [Nocardia sp. R7R-8]|uniref:hypothetical protein n=1 Tax=Nocardia sp. R7R-8 TaxID=3459304 RepID=UPI00403D5643